MTRGEPVSPKYRFRTADYYYLKLETHYLSIPYYNEKRRVRVLLPKDYQKEEWATYPVLYMHDGQNVFYSKEAFVGHSWKVIPTIKNNKHIPKMIVVAIDNAGGNRLDEYGPWVTDQNKSEEFSDAGGDGMDYGEWFVNELKPYIDNQYRTLPGREHTMLAGSSMGGIITAYMGSRYPEVFGVIGVFSLASWFSEREFLRFIEGNPLHPDTKVYIQVGTAEGDDTDKHFIDGKMNQAYIDSTIRYYQSLLKSGHSIDNIWLRILADETHHELYWAKHFLEYLEFAFSV